MKNNKPLMQLAVGIICVFVGLFLLLTGHLGVGTIVLIIGAVIIGNIND